MRRNLAEFDVLIYAVSHTVPVVRTEPAKRKQRGFFIVLLPSLLSLLGALSGLGYDPGWILFTRSHMPRRPKTPCRHRGCPELVDTPGYCAKHASEGAAWKKRNNAPKRITGRRLQKLRNQLFADDPLCAECRRHGRITPATQRDHIIPLSEGGTDDLSNIQGLCHDCHKAKTERESQRGRVRGGVGQIFG